MTSSFTLKNRVGCWLNERWRTELALLLPAGVSAAFRLNWKWLCNRHERLSPGDGNAVICEWQFSSLLTVARFFPRVGARLLRSCLREFPVVLADSPHIFDMEHSPRISVILPVGGRERLPLFCAVVASFWGQTLQDIEIIAVEYAEHPEFAEDCPVGVRYIHRPKENGREFNKSLAMNSGVKAARGNIVLLHDADVLVPTGYLSSILEIIVKGWEAVRPARFAFFLDQDDSRSIVRDRVTGQIERVEEVMANNPGLSIALTTDAYWRIGGHDIRFEGWGGEDDEFLERLSTLCLYRGGYCPVIHLWHPPAPKKIQGDRNYSLLADILTISVGERIVRLVQQH
jgi:hypothetical protein